MAIAVIGGLIVSTALSLFVVPAFYVLADWLLVHGRSTLRRKKGLGRRRANSRDSLARRSLPDVVTGPAREPARPRDSLRAMTSLRLARTVPYLLGLALLVLTTGCPSANHRVTRGELLELAQQPPENRGENVRVVQSLGSTDEPPEPAPRVRVGVSVYVAAPILGRRLAAPPPLPHSARTRAAAAAS